MDAANIHVSVHWQRREEPLSSNECTLANRIITFTASNVIYSNDLAKASDRKEETTY